MENSKQIIDPSKIENLKTLQASIGSNLVDELFKQFSTSAPDQIKQMRTAFASDDLNQLQRLAHTLKSSCGNLGAMRMNHHAQEIETLLHHDPQPSDLSPLDQHLSELEQHYSETIEHMRSLI